MIGLSSYVFLIVCFFELNSVLCGVIDRDGNLQNDEDSQTEKIPKLVEYGKHLRADGYDFNIETSDGFTKNENATIDKDGVLNIEGDYYFKFPNGQFEFYQYKAGVKGVIASVVFGNPIAKSNRIPSAAIASLAGGGLG